MCQLYRKANPKRARKLSEEIRINNLWNKEDREGYVAARTAKTRATVQKEYGVDWASQIPEAKAAMKKTVQAEYGFDSVSQVPEIKAKQSANRQRTMTEKYGVPFPAQVPEIQLKMLSSSFRKRKVHIDGVIHTVQGGSEDALVRLLVAKWGNDRNVVTQFNKKLFPLHEAVERTGYKPDFYIFSKDLFIECKSTWTLYGVRPDVLDENREKAKEAGSAARWIVHLGRGNKFVTLPVHWHTWSTSRLMKFLSKGKERVS